MRTNIRIYCRIDYRNAGGNMGRILIHNVRTYRFRAGNQTQHTFDAEGANQPHRNHRPQKHRNPLRRFLQQ